MASSIKHVYEITEMHGDFPDIEIGTHLIQAGHVRKYHEPYRSWDFVNLSAPVGSKDATRSIVGKHIGEYEKVKHLLGGKEKA